MHSTARFRPIWHDDWPVRLEENRLDQSPLQIKHLVVIIYQITHIPTLNSFFTALIIVNEGELGGEEGHSLSVLTDKIFVHIFCAQQTI